MTAQANSTAPLRPLGGCGALDQRLIRGGERRDRAIPAVKRLLTPSSNSDGAVMIRGQFDALTKGPSSIGPRRH
jgi:hypothetical protein